MLPNAGDELQGIKRGIFELADVVAVNKADGDQEAKAREASRAYSAALRYGSHQRESMPPILTTSGLKGIGLDKLWSALEAFFQARHASGQLEQKRIDIATKGFNRTIDAVTEELLSDSAELAEIRTRLDQELRSGRITLSEAVDRYATTLRTLLNP